MPKQNKLTYPKSIGAELWLYFILFIDARPFTGLVRTTFEGLESNSSIPKRELKLAIRKLVKHGFITMRVKKQNDLIIKLKYYGTRNHRFARSKRDNLEYIPRRGIERILRLNKNKNKTVNFYQ